MIGGLVRLGLGRMAGLGRKETDEKGAVEKAKKTKDIVRNTFGGDEPPRVANEGLLSKGSKKGTIVDFVRNNDNDKPLSGNDQDKRAASSDGRSGERDGENENSFDPEKSPSARTNDYDKPQNNDTETSRKGYFDKKRLLDSLRVYVPKSAKDYAKYGMYNELQNSSQGAAEVGAGLGNAIEGAFRGGDRQALVGSQNSSESRNDSGSAMPLLMGRGGRGDKGRGGTSEKSMETQIKGAADRVGNDLRAQQRKESNEPAHSFRATIQTGAWETFKKSTDRLPKMGELEDYMRII